MRPNEFCIPQVVMKHPRSTPALTYSLLTVVLLSACTDLGDLAGISGVQGNWERLRTGRGAYFHGLSFADETNGWAVGDSGQIIHTNDGGHSWIRQTSGTIVSLQCVLFTDASHGWAGGYSNLIGRTTDGGASWTWTRPSVDSSATCMAMSFVSSTIGWAGNNLGQIFHTQDGGLIWFQQTSGTRWAITSIQFLNRYEGWATGTNRVILKTTDGGLNWRVGTYDTLDYGRHVTVVFDDIFFVNRNKGWVSMTSILSNTDFHPTPMLCTTDGGVTWGLQSTPEDLSITKAYFNNENEGWASTLRGVLYTSDGGTHWNYQIRLVDALFVDLCFVNRTHGWVLGFTGDIYKYHRP